jgi:hypothetical protein
MSLLKPNLPAVATTQQHHADRNVFPGAHLKTGALDLLHNRFSIER